MTLRLVMVSSTLVVNVPPVPLKTKLSYVQFLISRVPDVAEYSTIELVFNVGVQERVSSPVSLRVSVTQQVVTVERLCPLRSRVPSVTVKVPSTSRSLVESWTTPLPVLLTVKLLKS